MTRILDNGDSICFLGTGNFLAPGRYWNSFVLDRQVLVEPSPTSLPHLRKVGLSASEIEVVVISHFHADHTFGWPFLLLELVQQARSSPLYVVGPAGVATFLSDMLTLGGVPNVEDAAQRVLDLRFVEIQGEWQQAGPLRFRGIEVEHVPHLECFGFLFDRGDRTIGYSGDTRPCSGLDTLAAASDVLILECNGPHAPSVPITHMDLAAVEELRRSHPRPTFVLTHLGEEPDTANLPKTLVPNDLETITY